MEAEMGVMHLQAKDAKDAKDCLQPSEERREVWRRLTLGASGSNQPL